MSQTTVKIDNIIEAYEHAYTYTDRAGVKHHAEWDRKEPPSAEQLAVFAPPRTASPTEVSLKLREFDRFHEQQIFGPGHQAITIENDPRYQRNLAIVQPKLKEMTMSDQSYAVAEINRLVWEALKPNLIFRDLVTIWHTNRPTFRFIRAILVPRAFDVGEGTDIPIAGEKYDYIDASMRKIGIRPLITREMIEDAQWDVVARQLAEGGRAMAQKENELGLAILNTAASSNNNYQGYGQYVTTATKSVEAYADIVSAIAGIRGQNAFPDTLAVHPTEEGSLLVDDKFIHSFYFGGLMKKALGPPEFFGQILGFRTLTSTLMTAGYSLMMDTARTAGFVIRRDVTVENVVDPNKDLQGAAFTARINLAVLRAMASCQIQVKTS